MGIDDLSDVWTCFFRISSPQDCSSGLHFPFSQNPVVALEDAELLKSTTLQAKKNGAYLPQHVSMYVRVVFTFDRFCLTATSAHPVPVERAEATLKNDEWSIDHRVARG